MKGKGLSFHIKFILGAIFCLFVLGCDHPWNQPHTHSASKSDNTYYASFSESPKTLDPAKSYASNEAIFTGQIYVPPLQYDYLKRPYQLMPYGATTLPQVTYLDKSGHVLPPNANLQDVAFSRYEITIRPDMLFQQHPALAKAKTGRFRYHDLTHQDLKSVHTLQDFTETGTRPVLASDYVYQIKRLANPAIGSPIAGLMSEYIVGFKEYTAQLQTRQKELYPKDPLHYLDLRQYELQGIKTLDDTHYQITLKGKYPQFIYWLAMPFFAPMPWEADRFYQQNGLSERNISLDWYPLGSGPYVLQENNPNKQMVLARNSLFFPEYYPSIGESSDALANLLHDAGKRLPFIDHFVFTLEKETIPRWSKFLQGYYDQSGVSSDSFGQAIQIAPNGEPGLTPALIAQGLRLTTSVNPGIFYLGFNMQDDLVGGSSNRARLLRQAIAIAVDYEEYIAIFLNARGVVAHGPIPPGIFGFKSGPTGINPVVYDWQNNHAVRKNLREAQQLLQQAGYPNGIDPKTGEPLVLYYDVAASSGPDDVAQLSWMRKQFAKIGIELQIRATQYNRFQEKVRTGNAQIFSWGWSADYPDPENFLFLLYGPNGKIKFGGENASNYANPRFDELFNQMKQMPSGPDRESIIAEMITLVQIDTPWLFGFYPKSFGLTQAWVAPMKPNDLSNNVLKYWRINSAKRADLQQQWNQPETWVLWLVGIALLALVGVVWMIYAARQKRVMRRTK